VNVIDAVGDTDKLPIGLTSSKFAREMIGFLRGTNPSTPYGHPHTAVFQLAQLKIPVRSFVGVERSSDRYMIRDMAKMKSISVLRKFVHETRARNVALTVFMDQYVID
jgi:hypothetical protein